MSARMAYSLTEAAQAVGLSMRSIRYLVRKRQVGYVKIGRRMLMRDVSKYTMQQSGSIGAESQARRSRHLYAQLQRVGHGCGDRHNHPGKGVAEYLISSPTTTIS
jgi:hypothetical protein